MENYDLTRCTSHCANFEHEAIHKLIEQLCDLRTAETLAPFITDAGFNMNRKRKARAGNLDAHLL
ncbi:hypothetical protein [Candidatus Erwinia dacicola]|uniref:Uncharacterized protein n=1 Tax=Candidatus Erwinia dacicola TaxID=252393 RepID=A0A1E7Z0H5_9GAMM|nr:hypothetical protein [Candidatus Erwinia dacicola]OFC62296.1 hypothetical protein BBW68_10150 [Candidatus Erwinia dacicola]RAP72684.1 hypothetical protein ACZ87_00486 [Candidatus Erwinia dacicola]